MEHSFYQSTCYTVILGTEKSSSWSTFSGVPAEPCVQTFPTPFWSPFVVQVWNLLVTSPACTSKLFCSPITGDKHCSRVSLRGVGVWVWCSASETLHCSKVLRVTGCVIPHAGEWLNTPWLRVSSDHLSADLPAALSKTGNQFCPSGAQAWLFRSVCSDLRWGYFSPVITL